MVQARAEVHVDAGSHYWCLREGSTVVAGSRQIVMGITSYEPRPYSVLVTGLTPGSVHTWKLANYVSGGGGGAAVVAGGDNDGPLLIEVRDAGPNASYSTAS